MATSKNTAKVEKSNTETQVTIEQLLEKLQQCDENAHNEKQALLSLFIEKAANVLINEKKVDRLNKCLAKLYKLHDKKLAKQYENAFIVISSEWQKDSKGKLSAMLDTNCIKFVVNGKVKTMSCTDVDTFKEKWNAHKTARDIMQTSLLAYIKNVKVEKAQNLKGIEDMKKAISSLYKTCDLQAKKMLADFMREKGIDIPTN